MYGSVGFRGREMHTHSCIEVGSCGEACPVFKDLLCLDHSPNRCSCAKEIHVYYAGLQATLI